MLLMGGASACSIFEMFSTSLEWVTMNKLGVTKVVHVIDDFLFMADSLEKCERDMKAFIDLCKQTGVPMARGKTGSSDSTPIYGYHFGCSEYGNLFTRGQTNTMMIAAVVIYGEAESHT